MPSHRPSGALIFVSLGRPARKTILSSWLLAGATFAAIVWATACAPRAPAVSNAPESKTVVPAAPKISLEPYHRSMREGMRRSFDQADEIIIGVTTGTYTDGPEGRVTYFDQFRVFNKDTWTWGPETNALLPILFQEIRPEIITAREFKSLSALDRTGICWDDYEGPRVVFLVEGIPTLLFLKLSFDEAENSSRRTLIDTYPVTNECRAKDIFDLMLRERAGK
jgi:hypothetical protein